jgi:ribosomal protein S18 acetylase RimI-like enzyme
MSGSTRYSLRPSDATDLPFLEEMLFEAFFWNPTAPRPSLVAFRKHPEFRKSLAGWGRPGDLAIIAENDEAKLGAAWFRLWTPDLHSYGFVDSDIPELGIAIASSHRSRGLGRVLLRELVGQARAAGFPALSLSVSPANRALRLYESEGFRKVGVSGESWTLLLSLDKPLA